MGRDRGLDPTIGIPVAYTQGVGPWTVPAFTPLSTQVILESGGTVSWPSQVDLPWRLSGPPVLLIWSRIASGLGRG